MNCLNQSGTGPKWDLLFLFAEWLGKSEYAKETMNNKGIKGKENYKKFRAGKMHWSQFMSVLLLKE